MARIIAHFNIKKNQTIEMPFPSTNSTFTLNFYIYSQPQAITSHLPVKQFNSKIFISLYNNQIGVYNFTFFFPWEYLGNENEWSSSHLVKFGHSFIKLHWTPPSSLIYRAEYLNTTQKSIHTISNVIEVQAGSSVVFRTGQKHKIQVM